MKNRIIDLALITVLIIGMMLTVACNSSPVTTPSVTEKPTETVVTPTTTPGSTATAPSTTAPASTPSETSTPPAAGDAESKTLAEFSAIADALGENNAVTEEKYTITGTVIEIKNTEYGNMTISDGTSSVFIYGTYDATGELRFDAMETKPQVGDVITVVGVASYYNGPQMKNGWIMSVKPGDGTVKPPESKEPKEDAPVAEILEYAYTLNNKETTTTVYTLTGVITRINSAYNSNYENISITIVINGDETHPIFCYRLVGEKISELEVGDTVTVKGKLNNYSNIIQMPQDSELVSYEEGPAADVSYTAYIRFDDLANRIEWVKEQQVWKMNSITVTNSKDESSVDAANTNGGRMPEGYYSPIRCYTGAGLSVEYTGMTKIEFICYNVNYVEPFQASTISGGTLSVSGDTVTIIFDEPTDHFKVSKLTAQIQVSQINVYTD